MKDQELETLTLLFKALDKAKDAGAIGETTCLEIKSRLSAGSVKSRMFDDIIEKARNDILAHHPSHEELISQLNPPIPYVPRDRSFSKLIQALFDPSCRFLRNPFKRKKRRTK